MIVYSYQQSGVAWVPWRMREALRKHGSGAVDLRLFAQALPHHERYGLPCDGMESLMDFHGLFACPAPDVVHLHHDYVAQTLIPTIRERWPSTRIVVTIHGEPDRSRAILGRHRPDLYHVVSPDLLRLNPAAPEVPFAKVRFLPNHPCTPAPDGALVRDTCILVPFSHVSRFKNHEAIADNIINGLTVKWLGKLPNSVLRDEIARARFCWVQLQGYVDILAMECWESGCVPVVGSMAASDMQRWSEIAGDYPPVPFASELKILGENEPDLYHSRMAGANFMQRWTMEKYARGLEALYAEALG